MFYNFTNGTPTGLTLRTTPSPASDAVKLNVGLFVQEQWTRNRLTLNAGLRFDYLNAYTPEQHVAASRFIGPRDFPRFEIQPYWMDVNPRVGAAFDLFGNGKTALKGSIGRWWKIETAVTYQSIPGIDIRAQWAAPNAAILPSLGRDLAGGARTANVQLIKPFTMFEDRLHQIDSGSAGVFRFPGPRFARSFRSSTCSMQRRCSRSTRRTVRTGCARPIFSRRASRRLAPRSTGERGLGTRTPSDAPRTGSDVGRRTRG